MNEQLAKLIEQWEGDSSSLIATYGKESDGRITHVLLRRVDGFELYSVYRYFTLGDIWVVSADANSVTAPEAFKALELTIEGGA